MSEVNSKYLYIGTAALLAGLLSWLVALEAWMSLGKLREAAVTLGLQVLVVGLVGGGIKWRLDQAAALRDFRMDVLRRLGQAHKTVYRVRRLLPRGGEAAPPELLGDLMDARQELGGLYHEVRPWVTLEDRKTIQRLLQEMRSYLEDVVVGGLVPSQRARRSIYEKFLDFRDPEGYETEFKERYWKIKKLADPAFKRPETAPEPLAARPS